MPVHKILEGTSNAWVSLSKFSASKSLKHMHIATLELGVLKCLDLLEI
jgi:hypothetical protein